MSRIVQGGVLCLAMLSVTGCVTSLAPNPPSRPTHSEVRKQFEEVLKLEKGTTATNPGAENASATQIATAGYNLVDTECREFFSSIAAYNNNVNFYKKETTMVGATAAGVLALLKRSPRTVAFSAIGTAFVADSLDTFQQFAVFTPQASNVSKLVSDAMLLYKRSAPPTDTNVMTDVGTAYALIGGYADLCTYDRIQQFVGDAIKAAKPVDDNAGARTIFNTEDKNLLAGINSYLKLPTTLLSDEQYVKIAWFIRAGTTNTDYIAKFRKEFSAIADNISDNKGQLTSGANSAGTLFETIAERNSQFAAAIKAVDPSKVTGEGFVGTRNGPGAPRIPNIQIR